MSFYTFLPKLFNMSLTASVAIVLVILLRLLLKKAPKVISYGLWVVVLFRLLCPVSIGSSLSLYNLFDAPAEESGALTSVIEYVPSNIVHTAFPSVALPIPGISNIINEALPQGEEQLRADPLEGPIYIATYIWMTGVLVMAIYSIFSYLQLRRKLSVVVPLRENIFISDDIKSPFVVGLFRPRIYLPCNLGDKEHAYIILHEQHHIKRLDHIMKALSFLALAIHWFNPLVWVAFSLTSKDMEMSCDEAVIRKIGGDVRADYSASLLTLATGRRIIAGTPLAFGEGDTKGRIRNLANWKKPAVWIVVVAILVCAIVAVSMLTNPVEEVEIGAIESVTVDNVRVSDEAATELISLINSHHRSPFVVGLDDPNSLSRAIQLNCANGDFYVLHYQYYSGFSFDPRHAGEDDYRSILTFFTAEDGGQKAWKMEYDFDAKLREWLSEYSSPSFGAFAVNEPYGVVDVTYQSPIWQDIPTDNIKEIIDPTDDPNFAYDTAVEKIYQDENNEYFLNGLYSQHVIVHYTDGSQEDIVTALNVGRATIADLDRFGIRYWAQPKADPLDAAISTVILDHYASDIPDGLIHVESHVLLANETMCGTPLLGADNHIEKVTAYLLVYHVKYSTYGGTLEAVGGSYVPTAITFRISDSGEHILEEYWEPRDGSYYVKDVRDKFPGASADDALNDQAYIEELKAQSYNKAITYLNNNIRLDVRIAELLDEIQTFPAHSSNPGDYIRAHESEYEELLGYGKYTLRYCFAEFLQGGQIDLRGHIMALACQDIADALGEKEEPLENVVMTGQDWFDGFCSHAQVLAKNHSMEDLEKSYPATFLLLQLRNDTFATKDAPN